MVLLDLVVPGWRGVITVERLRASNPELPITIVSGFDRQGELPVQQ